ncbi:immunoglobulin-like domain-containing protein [Listeria kieliensis]|uniref:immunoglobulin-like domain-containing protein n=1 Tax=Listeria kieliensis TaxID=1621700 RepID=UPI000E21440D|nr:immunoglobulin-like domain-containing protein [Listeria kieliensis]
MTKKKKLYAAVAIATCAFQLGGVVAQPAFAEEVQNANKQQGEATVASKEANVDDEKAARLASLPYDAEFDNKKRNLGTTSFDGDYLNIYTHGWTAMSSSTAVEKMRQYNNIVFDNAFKEFFETPNWNEYIEGSVSRTTTIDEGWWGWSRERYGLNEINFYNGKDILVKNEQHEYKNPLSFMKGKEYDDGLVYDKKSNTLTYRTARYDGTLSALWTTQDLNINIGKWSRDTGKQIPKQDKYTIKTKSNEKPDRGLAIGGGSLNAAVKELEWKNAPTDPADEKAVINASDKELVVGDKFDPMEGVTATDKDGSDITSSIKVTENTVDTSKPGDYKVTYSVVDKDGNTVNKTITVTVKDRNPADKPVINASDKEIFVKEDFDPKKGVTATDKDGNDITSSIKVIENTVDNTKPGKYKVTYSVTDKNGNTATKTITVTVKENKLTTTDFVIGKDSNITGTYEGNVAYFTVTDASGKTFKGGTVKADGTYKFYAHGNVVTPGKFTITSYDAKGNALATATGTAIKEKVPYKGSITVDKPYKVNKESYVYGTFKGDVSMVTMVVDGKEYKAAKLNADGTYSFYAYGKVTSSSQKVQMKAYDPDGALLDTKTVTLTN